jgi:hypothetical protein
MYTYKKRKKKKKKKSEAYANAYTLIYEEGKEKEKMFFFSALRVVVHLEKAISEPAITVQKEKRENKKSCLYTNQERKKENEGTRERKSDHKNKRERRQDDEQKHTRHSNWGQIILYMSFRKICRNINISVLFTFSSRIK